MNTVVFENQVDTKLDLLDRQGFIDQLLTIANALSDKKRNVCYALNGDWGVGKSFVLDMFEEQANNLGVEGQELSRYLVFRYNCWEYDYYEEPLVAIVAAILDQIDEKVDLLPADTKERIVAALKVVGKSLVKKAIDVIGEKTGVDLQEAAEIIKDGAEAAKKRVAESHEYDQCFNFKKNLKKLREAIASLSEYQTVIFIVDELDRCLPEYTIKVLERLHHLFEGIPNVQVILSIDAGQLEHVVKQIYGVETDAKRYLNKFIQFELKLDEGSINANFNRRFDQYTSSFEVRGNITNEAEVDEFIMGILDGLDMRKRISIVERCSLIHDLLSGEEKSDISYICLEILLAILHDQRINLQHAKSYFKIEDVFAADRLWMASEKKHVPLGLTKLSESYREQGAAVFYFENYPQRYILDTRSLLGTLLYVYRKILGFDSDSLTQGRVDYADYASKFWELLQAMS